MTTEEEKSPHSQLVTKSRVYADVNKNLTHNHALYSDFEIVLGDINKYEIIKPIGSGKYSNVFLATSTDNEMCAIKILRHIPKNKIQRELYILKRIAKVANTTKHLDTLYDPESGIYSIVTRYYDNLPAKIIFPNLRISDIRSLMYTLLKVLKRTHKLGVIHRDIKPGNVLINSNKRHICIIDWGLSDLYISGTAYTTRVSTLRYKAPELLLGYEYYDYGIDIWGAGCVMAEMMIRTPFFNGRTIEEVMSNIANLWSSEVVTQYAEKYSLEIPKEALSTFPGPNSNGWPRVQSLTRPSKKDDAAFDLLTKLLTVDHSQRITAKEALKHPFFSPLKTPEPIV